VRRHHNAPSIRQSGKGAFMVKFIGFALLALFVLVSIGCHADAGIG
jgi:hypothetical protein